MKELNDDLVFVMTSPCDGGIEQEGIEKVMRCKMVFGKWYYREEDGCINGPFETQELARSALGAYSRFLELVAARGAKGGNISTRRKV